ncbi:hypothetical protein PCAR4_940043 [Paraburkholderia caribensis]|nr:hypothetical protein PCAR4_940043 [Paraburkholderia caribensis]
MPVVIVRIPTVGFRAAPHITSRDTDVDAGAWRVPRDTTYLEFARANTRGHRRRSNRFLRLLSSQPLARRNERC